MTLTTQALPRLRAHLSTFFSGHEATEDVWLEGPLAQRAPWFSVLRFAPGPRTPLWTYASIGASALDNPRDALLEFVVVVEKPTRRAVELLTMTADYHADHGLGPGHTGGFGEPWLPGADCEDFLISLPYPFGPDLEICQLDDRHVHFLWLLPITGAERRFAVDHGLEALEQRFESSGLRYWSKRRASVV
ncbi:MAG TPA: suppressor of fused domain protein [Thermoanaerobaculia bacterium]|nr:suppressor of fused domain protein [Thermoanaerobaculia bacterium]